MYISLLGCSINVCFLKCHEKILQANSCEDVEHTQPNVSKFYISSINTDIIVHVTQLESFSEIHSWHKKGTCEFSVSSS